MLRRIAFTLFFSAICRASGQEALSEALLFPADASAQPVPESAWVDLRQNVPGNSRTQSAPPWLEAVTLLPAPAGVDTLSKSVFRIRVTKPSPDHQVLLFRLFFEDKSDR